MAFRLDRAELFEAVFDEQAFEALLARVAQAVGARSYVAGWHYPDKTATLFRHSGRWSDEQVERYNRDFAFIDVWNVALIQDFRPNQAVDLTTLVSDREVEQSTLYNDFFRAIGDDTFRALTVPGRNELGAGAIAFHRGRGQSAFEAEAVALLDEHAPELGRLLALRGRFSAVEREAASLEAMLDTAAGPLILATGDGSVIRSNHAARALLADGDVLSLGDDRIVARANGAGQQFKTALAAACCPAQPVAGTVALRREGKLPLLASMTPVRLLDGRWRALIMLRDPSAQDEKLADTLRQLFGLTPAEADITCRLAAGVSVQDIATARRASIETVRTQIKSITGKLGCSRQVEIIALVKSLPTAP